MFSWDENAQDAPVGRTCWLVPGSRCSPRERRTPRPVPVDSKPPPPPGCCRGGPPRGAGAEGGLRPPTRGEPSSGSPPPLPASDGHLWRHYPVLTGIWRRPPVLAAATNSAISGKREISRLHGCGVGSPYRKVTRIVSLRSPVSIRGRPGRRPDQKLFKAERGVDVTRERARNQELAPVLHNERGESDYEPLAGDDLPDDGARDLSGIGPDLRRAGRLGAASGR